MPEAVTLYGDESGNTGADLLAPDQPHFVYAMLEATAAQRTALIEAVNALRSRLGSGAPKEFKFSRLNTSNPGRKICLELAHIVADSGAGLHLAFVEKRYQLCSMLVETYADSGGPLEQELVLAPGSDRRRLAAALYESLPEATLKAFAGAVLSDDVEALRGVGAQIRGIMRLHPSAEASALAKHLDLCASEPFRFAEPFDGRPKHAEKPATVLHVFFPFMKQVDDHLAARNLNADLVADRDSVFGPALDEIHRMFSATRGLRGSKWVR